ncbi:hypothetical protein Kpho02_37350 [Kitasatospora phosalacinea]|uniref:Uncharacterized protein n=1 Tax=Kitasatospora phosalacinea TaxID=2065 RepID=A0A9W6QAH3_9ACTN|nr:hypothetical protein Kpho02_37350 [Kitasatospora phosalacinea]
MQGLPDGRDVLRGQRPGEVDAVDVGADVTGDGTYGERAHDSGVLSVTDGHPGTGGAPRHDGAGVRGGAGG